jgi:hypothetical protein
LEFSFSEKEKGTALATTRNLFYDEILPVLNKGFDEVNDTIYIDRMVIEVGAVSAGNFSTQFIKAFTESRAQHFQPTHNNIPVAINSKPEDETQQGLVVSQFIYFLQRGYWAWNWQTKTEDELLEAVGALFTSRSKLLSLLSGLRGEGPLVAERLVQFIAQRVAWRRLLRDAIIQYHPAVKQAQGYFHQPFENPMGRGDNLYALLFKKLLLSPPLQFDKELINLLLQMLQEYLGKTQVSSKTATTVKKMLAQLQKAGDDAVLDKWLPLIKKMFAGKPEERAIISNDTGTDPIPYFTNRENEKINIANAGLILVHPYLRYVFRDLEWTNSDHQFVNINAQQKAILWLQYLINGKSRQPEHALVLNKILCGWPVHMPLPGRCNFSGKEKQAVQDIIDSLREHWRVLKNTSQQGLVVSFIERPGVIEKTNNDYLLRIERNTIDILLESLPFGIQTIKLPWNEYIIHTEWAY